MKICIQTQEDGTFSVYDEEVAPQGGEGNVSGAETPAQTAATADEALEIARGMLGGGQGGDAEALFKEPAAAVPAADAMQAGFRKGRGAPAGY